MAAGRWPELVIGAAFRVYEALGPGLLDSVYRLALEQELRSAGVPFVRGLAVPIRYRGLILEGGLRLDFVVGAKLVVEVKSVERLSDLHGAQLLTYMKLAGCPLGLLINFNVPLLQHGIRFFVRGAPQP